MINGSYGGWYPDDRNNGAGAPDTDWATGGNRQYRHRLIIIYYSRVRIYMQYNIQMNCGLWINDTSNTEYIFISKKEIGFHLEWKRYYQVKEDKNEIQSIYWVRRLGIFPT